MTEKEISDALYLVLEKGHKVCLLFAGVKGHTGSRT